MGEQASLRDVRTLQAVISCGPSWTATRWLSARLGFEAGPHLVRLLKTGQIVRHRRPWGSLWRRGDERAWHAHPDDLLSGKALLVDLKKAVPPDLNSTLSRKPYKEEYLRASRGGGKSELQSLTTHSLAPRDCCRSFPGQEHWDNCPFKGTR